MFTPKVFDALDAAPAALHHTYSVNVAPSTLEWQGIGCSYNTPTGARQKVWFLQPPSPRPRARRRRAALWSAPRRRPRPGLRAPRRPAPAHALEAESSTPSRARPPLDSPIPSKRPKPLLDPQA